MRYAGVGKDLLSSGSPIVYLEFDNIWCLKWLFSGLDFSFNPIVFRHASEGKRELKKLSSCDRVLFNHLVTNLNSLTKQHTDSVPSLSRKTCVLFNELMYYFCTQTEYNCTHSRFILFILQVCFQSQLTRTKNKSLTDWTQNAVNWSAQARASFVNSLTYGCSWFLVLKLTNYIWSVAYPISWYLYIFIISISFAYICLCRLY